MKYIAFTENKLQLDFLQLLKNKITARYDPGLTVFRWQKAHILYPGMGLDKVTKSTYRGLTDHS